jgi:hypothetical protein
MLNGGSVAKAWQPMSAATCVSPELALGDLERAEHRPLRAARAERGWAFGQGRPQDLARAPGVGGESGAPRLRLRTKEAREGAQHDLGHVLPLHRDQVLAVDADAEPPLVGQRLQLLLDEGRHALLDHEHALLVLDEVHHLVGHERMDDVQHEERYAAPPEGIGQPQQRQRAQRGGGETALQDDPDVGALAGHDLVEATLGNEAARRGETPLELLHLLGIGGRRVAQPRVVERGRRQPIAHAHGRSHIVPADHGAAHVGGADAQADHRGEVRDLRHREGLFHHVGQVLQLGTRVEEQQR